MAKHKIIKMGAVLADSHEPTIRRHDIGDIVTPGTSDDLARYHALDLWGDYLKATQVWKKAHLEYCNTFMTDPAKDDKRKTMIAAQRIKDAILSELRQTPEHLAAFGW